jgi:hypothetical protein
MLAAGMDVAGWSHRSAVPRSHDRSPSRGHIHSDGRVAEGAGVDAVGRLRSFAGARQGRGQVNVWAKAGAAPEANEGGSEGGAANVMSWCVSFWVVDWAIAKAELARGITTRKIPC